MASTTSNIQVSFDITTISKIVKPTAQVFFNEFDQLGLLLGLPRLTDEGNIDYKARLRDVSIHRANSTYLGLIYGITRELGLSITDAITITANRNVDNTFVATNPGVEFRGPYLYLYENCDINNESIEKTIDRYERDESYTLQDLVTEINTSLYFTATLATGVDPFTRAITLINESNIKTVFSESLPTTTRIELEYGDIIEGTLFFSSSQVFYHEVATVNDLATSGDYAIDYINGIVFTYDTPPTGLTCRYKYIEDPFVARSSPVIIHSTTSTEFKTKMFEQVLNDLGETINGKPTLLGAYLINEFMSVYPEYWGK